MASGGDSAGRLFTQVTLTLLVALCWLPIVVILTARHTVLAPAFYSGNLDHVQAYDRVYTEIIPDPAVDDLLAGLPVDRTLVTANLRTVLPPSTLRGLTDEQISRIVGYLRGDNDAATLTIDLRPMFGNISSLANRYIAGQLGTGSTYQAKNVSDFTDDLLAALDDIAAGRPPQRLPTIQLTPQQADRVLGVVLDRLDPPTRARVSGQAKALLEEGDVAGVLALIGPPLFHGDDQAIARLRARLVDGATLDLGVSLSDLRDKRTVRAIGQFHTFSPALPAIAAACGLAIFGGLVGAAIVATRRGRSPVRAVGYAALAAAGTAAVAGVVLRVVLPNPMSSLDAPGSKLPRGAAGVLSDFGDRAYGGIEGGYLRLTLFAFVLGAVVMAFSLLAAASRRLARHPRWQRLVATAVVAVPALVLVTWAAFPGAAVDGRVRCEGAVKLCDRPYNEVTYAASHNAMANNEDLFLGAGQDPSIVHQLDLGVRGLLIDVHHWTTPEEVTKVLDSLPTTTRAAIGPLVRGAVSSRPGLWLCHDLCQMGALDVTAQLRDIGGWLDRNPTEVVTLIVQENEVPASEIIGAVEAAGVANKVLTPPADPRGSWPTLRQMISSDHRLVIFTESQDTPGSFLRSFYRYGSDTPFDARTSAELTGCALERGSADSSLLLMNHWVTTAAPSRRAALEDNASGTLVARARDCARLRGHTPNFLAVDFVNIGGLTEAVDVLNGVAPESEASRRP